MGPLSLSPQKNPRSGALSARPKKMIAKAGRGRNLKASLVSPYGLRNGGPKPLLGEAQDQTL